MYNFGMQSFVFYGFSLPACFILSVLFVVNLGTSFVAFLKEDSDGQKLASFFKSLPGFWSYFSHYPPLDKTVLFLCYCGFPPLPSKLI